MEKEYKLTFGSREVLIRPRQDNDLFPSHTPYRVLIGHTIHLIQSCNKTVMEQRMLYEPEVRHRKCPSCKKLDWSVWIPTTMPSRMVFEDGQSDHFQSLLHWHIVCLHCARIVGQIDSYDLYAGNPTVYIYDPTDDTIFHAFSPKQRPKRASGKS